MMQVIMFLILLLINIMNVTSLTSGYLYINVYNKAGCNSNAMVLHQYGYLTNECIVQYNTTSGEPIGSLYASCNTSNGTVQYYSSTNCGANTNTSSFFNYIDTCLSTASNEYLSEIGPAYEAKCELAPISYTDLESNNILVMQSGVLTNFYGNTSFCSSNVISFSAIVGDYCFQNTTATSSPGRLYQCTQAETGFIPSYAEFNAVQDNTCVSESSSTELNTTCAKLPSFSNNALAVGYYGKTSCFPSTSNEDPGYVVQTIFAEATCKTGSSQGIPTYQLGIMTNQCLPKYNESGYAIGSTYATCNATNTIFTNFNSTNCAIGTIVENFNVDNQNCHNDGKFIPSLGEGQITICVTHPASYTDVTELMSSIPLPFDAVLTTSYGQGNGCESNIIQYSAVAVNTCFSSAVNASFDQGKSFTCSSTGVPSYYEYNPVPSASDNETCSFEKGQIDLNTTCTKLPFLSSQTSTVSYYGVTECYIANAPAPAPTPAGVPTKSPSTQSPSTQSPSTQSPSTQTLPAPGLTTGAKAGIAICVLFVAGAVGFLMYRTNLKNKTRTQEVFLTSNPPYGNDSRSGSVSHRISFHNTEAETKNPMTRVDPVTSSSSGHNARYVPPIVPELPPNSSAGADRNRSNDLL